jgi:hypothetical protein
MRKASLIESCDTAATSVARAAIALDAVLAGEIAGRA